MAKLGKGALVDQVSTRMGLSKAQTGKFVDSLLNVISESLIKGNEVAILGFGTLKVVDRAARTGVNPKTGKKIKIPPYKTITFKVSKNLKEAVNKGK